MEYNPDKVKQVPTTPAELLAWCKANPNRLIYARPANSGPGRTFIMAVTLVWLLIALRFVNPTQLVSRVKEHPQPT